MVQDTWKTRTKGSRIFSMKCPKCDTICVEMGTIPDFIETSGIIYWCPKCGWDDRW